MQRPTILAVLAVVDAVFATGCGWDVRRPAERDLEADGGEGGAAANGGESGAAANGGQGGGGGAGEGGAVTPSRAPGKTDVYNGQRGTSFNPNWRFHLGEVTGAEAQVKARVDELEEKLDKWKTLAAPVFELYPGLSVMVVVGHLDVDRFEDITQNLLSHVGAVKTRVVLLDLSAAVVDDNEVASQLTKAIRTVRLLGASCVIAGMQTSLARAMEPLIADLGTVRSYSCMELALEAALDIIGYRINQKD